MSEKIELIDAKDLPVTEEEDVTVLCVGAGGEMKRRDAGSFGMKMSELAELPTTEAEEVDVICVDAEGNLCRKSSAGFGGGGAKGITIVTANNGVASMNYSEIIELIENGETVFLNCGLGGVYSYSSRDSEYGMVYFSTIHPQYRTMEWISIDMSNNLSSSTYTLTTSN